MTLLELPFGLYRTFVIENRFGFNKMTPALYVLDFAKSIALAAAFGLPLGAIVLWLMAQAGGILVALRLAHVGRVQSLHGGGLSDVDRAALQPVLADAGRRAEGARGAPDGALRLQG